MLREQGYDVVAAHYDHALQPASAEMAAHVERLCAGLGVELISERRDSPVPKGSLEAGARALRYAFLERAAAKCGATGIAIAHTADDVVEGAVLHLLRGCGIAGLRGMPARRGAFVRPLVDHWREQIDAYLAEHGVTPFQDLANTDRRFARVAVRLDVLPALERDRPGIKRRLHAVARRAADLQAQVETAAESALAARPSARGIAALPEPVAAECLRILYRRAGGAEPGLGRAHIEAMLTLAGSPGRGGRGVDLPGGLRFRIVGSRAEVVPGVVHLMETRLEFRPCPGCAESEAAHLRPGLDLRLTFRRPGMRIHQARGSRKLQDVFVDARVPREDRDTWPLVVSGDRLAWVPGVAIDDQLQAKVGDPSIHVTVTRILSAGSPKKPVLESANSPRGESS
jgi:tRNA(Ile)-lysidine synthetase-like protein